MARLLSTLVRHPDEDTAAPTERGLDRLVNFSDAVVAIAITLVALPLVDLAQELRVNGGEPGVRFVQQYGASLGAAALSFVVIGGFWREHHAEWERAVRYTPLLALLNLGWLATIVFLPVPTVLLFRSATYDPVTLALYIGAMLVDMVLSRCMQLEIAAHCGEPDEFERNRFRLLLEWIPVVLMAIALVLAVTLPAVGVKALYIVVLSFPLSALLRRIRRRRTAVTAS